MEDIGLEESKKIQIGILDFFDQFCRKEGIRYSLSYGSLIGAIRHKGFIPWDDDIDIMMPREDYNILISKFKDANGIYVIHCVENDSEYCYPYAKIEDTRTILSERVNANHIGINMDIFPLDYSGDTVEEARKNVSKLWFIKKVHRAKLIVPSKRNALWKRVLYILCNKLLFCVDIRNLALEISKRASEFDKPTSLVSMFLGEIFFVLPVKSFDQLIRVPFENGYYYSIPDYDVFLRSVYGDYMQLPPIEKQCSPHTIDKACWK